MSVTYHERPGVYSDWDASGLSAARTGGRVLAVAGVAGTAPGLYPVTNYREAAAKFGEGSQLGRLLRLAFQNGAGTILACPVASDTLSAYESALELIFSARQAQLCVVGSARADVHASLASHLTAAAAMRGECIGFAGADGDGKSALISRAAALGCERLVLVGPDVYLDGQRVGGMYAAAALAGTVAAQSDPALPLNGAVLQGLGGAAEFYDDTDLDALIRGGVTVVESTAAQVCVIRAVTTRTRTAGEPDATFRELSTILIADDVIPALRTQLRTRFARAKNNASTRNAIRNQVILTLEDRVRREIIDSYSDLTVRADDGDATVCVVEFGFVVTHGLNRIYLTAHLQV